MEMDCEQCLETKHHCQALFTTFIAAFPSSGYSSATLTKSQLSETSEFAGVLVKEEEEEVRRIEKEEEARRLEKEEEIRRLEERREADDNAPTALGEVETTASAKIKEEEAESEDTKRATLKPEETNKNDEEEWTGEIKEQDSLNLVSEEVEKNKPEPTTSPSEAEGQPDPESTELQGEGDRRETTGLSSGKDTTTTIINDVDSDHASNFPPTPVVPMATDPHESSDKEVQTHVELYT